MSRISCHLDPMAIWTDVGVTGEQYVWEGKYWVSVTGADLALI